MTPIQQLMLGVGAKKKTYVDDVFSNTLWEGNATTRDINNGIDLAGEGGLVWIKNRDNQYQDNRLFDTTALPQSSSPFYSYPISSNTTGTRGASANGLKSFNSNGFSVYTDTSVNGNNESIASWTFRKAPGFFDVVTWTGNGVDGRNISHSLGSVPGCIMIKRTSLAEDWAVYHKSNGNTQGLTLNSTAYNSYAKSWWDETTPTATTFRIDNANRVNTNGETYVAYVFAGGESTAATARSVNFDGSDDYLALPNHSDLDLGNSDFTLEAWIKPNDASTTNQYFYSAQDNGFHWYWSQNKIYFSGYDGSSWFLSVESPAICRVGQWYHVAITRSSNVFRLFLNGIEYNESTHTNTFKSPGSTVPNIGRYSPSTNNYFKGSVSNFRLVKGTALYTSSFRPPTEPLTNVTNTKLLCCNNSSAAGSTVTPGTITNNGSTASTDSPFDDPAAFTFGDSKEGIIKCGSYKGDSSTHSNPTEVNVGFEPQWLLVKSLTSNVNWVIVDSMRQWTSDTADGVANVKWFEPNTSDAEATGSMLTLTSTGFIARQSSYTAGNNDFIYIAIRRPDGYVGKPVETATDVFAMDTGIDAGGTIPAHTSGFPVDFQLNRKPASSWDTYAGSRLTQGRYLATNSSSAEAGTSGFQYDSNEGWGTGSQSGYLSWMWKRHAGFDVVTYTGNGTSGRQIPHSLNGVPEFMWAKPRNNADHWKTYHKGYNGGTNPEQYTINLNDSAAEWSSSNIWNNTAPTSTHFTVGNDNGVNANNWTYLVCLFRSVDGISKVGYYDGSSSDVVITTGFQPRFVIIKSSTTTYPWMVLDSERGWGTSDDSGDDPYLRLNLTNAEVDFNNGYRTSTGFVVDAGSSFVCQNGHKYIYYAHA